MDGPEFPERLSVKVQSRKRRFVLMQTDLLMNELPWFRLYTDFLTNGRVRLLSFDDRCHYVELLCLKASGGLNEFKDDPDMQLMRVAKALELSINHADECRHRLVRVGLIKDNWEPKGWDKRQYKTDHSTDRVRKHREKKVKQKQRVKSMKRDETVTVTAPDTDTESDTERECASRIPPRGFAPSKKSLDWALAKGFSSEVLDTQTERFMVYERPRPTHDWEAAWRSWILKTTDFMQTEETTGSLDDQASEYGMTRFDGETDKQLENRIGDFLTARMYGKTTSPWR
jgi:hypothetical protein